MSRRTEDDHDEPTPRLSWEHRNGPPTGSVEDEAQEWHAESRRLRREHDAEIARDEVRHG